jgi:hypothetical protein
MPKLFGHLFLFGDLKLEPLLNLRLLFLVTIAQQLQQLQPRAQQLQQSQLRAQQLQQLQPRAQLLQLPFLDFLGEERVQLHQEQMGFPVEVQVLNF